MADLKISQLTAITTLTPATDVLPVVDVTGTTKKITTNQLLGSGGTATLASATITGDLTVDTNVLKVDTSLNRVGIGTASPSETLHISKGSAATFLRLQDSSSSNYIGTDTGNFRVLNASVQDLVVATQAGVFTFGDGAGGTRMTLNATGLGVGQGTINAKVDAQGASSLIGFRYIESTSGGLNRVQLGAGSGFAYIDANASLGFPVLQLRAAGNTAVTIDSSLNVGIGVTPNPAWNVGSGKTIQLTANASLSGGLTNSTYLAQNWYYDNINSRYLVPGYCLVYEQNKSNGSHVWYNTTLGAASGDIATIIPAMTLDINGNLILRSSATPATLGTNGQLTVNATSNTNLRFSYRGSDGVTRVANITLA